MFSLKEDKRNLHQASFTNNLFRTYVISKIQLIDGVKYYWLKDAQTTENSQKDSKELKRLQLGATLLCNYLFNCYI